MSGRCADLFDPAAVQHDDAVGHGHGFDLIVGDVDRGDAKATLQGFDFNPHLVAQFRVQIRQRFIEEEQRRVTHNGTAHGIALTLAAGELGRFAVEILGEIEHLRRLIDPFAQSRLSAFCGS